MKLDILAFGAHPDDLELSCSGTLLNQIAKGNTVGLIDLTRGEMGSRGTAEIRDKEGQDAAAIIGANIRENLNLADAFFENNQASQLKVISALRKYRPDYVFCNAEEDRHPDHGRSAQLIEDAAFLSGLVKIQTFDDGKLQEPWRPKIVLHYIQDRELIPDIVMDISEVWDKKMECILAHRSQFYDPKSSEPDTYIASKGFMEMIETRARETGRSNGFKYAEGFTCRRVIGIINITNIV